jgi:cation diffusion facilitator CzcD-associated flavoprotein CzcO
VIGNGSTGLQVVGAMQPLVKELYHFVRTPTFIQGYLDALDLTPEMRAEWRRKGTENEGREWREHVRNIWLDREKYWVMFTSGTHKLNKLVVSRAIASMEKQVKDPELRWVSRVFVLLKVSES